MRPSRLVFNGINSFSERTEIDFDKLTANGIFGIFGDTGSGKSTVLDCINFALYGDVDRSKKKIDIINYNCDQAEVEFEFNLLTEGKRKRFRVERSIKKKSGLGKAMLYADDGNGWQCVADNTTSVNQAVEGALGLSAEDFRKCIALPQGEFAQFVKSAPAERFKLIERLFSLSRYGDRLKERLAVRESEIEARYLTAAGELAAYADVSEQDVAACESRLAEDAAALKSLESESGKATAESERLQKILTDLTELNQARASCAEAESDRAEMEKLRGLLRTVPLCRRVAELGNELRDKKQTLAQRNAEVEKTGAALRSAEEKSAALTEEAERGAFDRRLDEMKKRLAVYEAASEEVKELAEAEARLMTLRSNFRTSALKADQLREEELAAQKEAENAKKRLDERRFEDVGEVLEKKLKPAVLQGEYADQLVYFGDLRESIKGYDDGGELYRFVREELSDRIEYYKNLIMTVQAEKIDVAALIKQIKEQNDRREVLLKEYDAAREKWAACRQKTALADSQTAVLRRDGEEQRSRVEKLKVKLSEAFGQGVGDYSAAVRALQEEVEALAKERERIADGLEKVRAEREKTGILLEGLRARSAAVAGEIASLEEKIRAALAESGYRTEEECASVIAYVDGYGDAEGRLNAYDGRLIALKAKIEEKERAVGSVFVTSQEVAAAEQKAEDLSVAVRNKHADVRLGETTLCRLKEKLDKKRKGEQALAQIQKSREIVFQLKELTRGNKLMEYIAGEYLSDISKAATVTLLKLTSGRYYLSYTDTFYVGDNYNEGKLRGVNTLSGGETFLVSLSLALALSTAICRGSLKSIEFFFLDEGFGTLDESLLDTVMDSLEKLRSSDFTIGIISHVEELKHRIESKIIVNKATETHGSTIQVSV